MKISIVMSAYNNLDLTKIAYKSITENTDVPYRLTIVENNSADDSREWLMQLEDENVNKIFPEKNVGCVGARNLGIKDLNEDTEHVVFMDNDIVATKGWASSLVEFMEENQNIGICGPVTNFAGNPQLIDGLTVLDYSEIDAIEERAEKIRRGNKSHSIAPNKWPIVGFCFFVRRKVIDVVGLFDNKLVAFGDETDYCLRAESNGWKLSYVNNVYVHHWGHASKKTEGAHGKEDLKKSRIYFRNKWGNI